MKPLTAIVPDFRDALEEGVEDATRAIVYDLKREGPFWTGFFQSLWEVNAGKKAIQGTIDNPLDVPNQPLKREITPVDVPESPNLGGYTIGNRAKYRAYAMDLVPGKGARASANARLTAPRNWFDRYFNSGMRTTINTQLNSVFRRYK